MHRSSHIISIMLANNGSRVVVTGHGNHTVHFGRRGIETVKHATANIHNVRLSRSNASRMVNVVDVTPRSNSRILIMDRHKFKGHSSLRSCHVAGHNNGNIGAVGVASGAKGLITLGGIASRGSLVVVGGSKVAVHLSISALHAVNHTSRNIGLVHFGSRKRRVTSMYGILGSSRIRTRGIVISSSGDGYLLCASPDPQSEIRSKKKGL